MKISRIKHVILTSIIFLIIIVVMVVLYSAQITMLTENTTDVFNRVVATRDINPGEMLTLDNVELRPIQDATSSEKKIYRLNKDDNIRNKVSDTEAVKRGDKGVDTRLPNDDLWALGKIAREKIYKGEIVLNNRLMLSENYVAEGTRLYAIPFESSTTGGYNISNGEMVDICLLYADNDKAISEYQNLPDNKVIDIVLAGKKIADIRDESGNSRKKTQSEGVMPGYICFNLTYEEINKIEIAKRQGTLFIGKTENYYKEGSQAATFMPTVTMPSF